MSTDEQIRDAIARRAAEWFLAHRAATLEQAEHEAFFAWLKLSPMHVEEYLRIAVAERGLAEAAQTPKMSLEELRTLALADSSDRIIELATIAPLSTATDAAERSTAEALRAASAVPPSPSALAIRAPAPQRVRLALAAAASIGAAAIGLAWLLQAPAPATAQTFRTMRGAQHEYRLADGSALRLDSDSEVSVALSPTERLVTLRRGQALFRVAHDAHRAFRVQSGAVSALAIGTEFDVYQRPDATLITVLEGQIAVSRNAAREGEERAPAVKVSAGQQVRVGDGAFPAAASSANLSMATGWLAHKIAFEQRPLEEIAEEFNRYNDTQIAIEDPSLRHLPVSGVFDASDVDSFAAFLASLDGVGVTRTSTAIAVWRRGYTQHVRPSR